MLKKHTIFPEKYFCEKKYKKGLPKEDEE